MTQTWKDGDIITADRLNDTINPSKIRDTYTDDVNISGWNSPTSFSSSNHEITFTGKAGDSGILIPVDVPNGINLDTNLYISFTYSTSRVGDTDNNIGVLLAKDDGTFFNTTSRLVKLTQNTSETEIKTKVNLKQLGYTDIPTHYNLLFSVSSDYSVTIKDVYFNKSGVSQSFEEEVKKLDSATFTNGSIDIINGFTKWRDNDQITTTALSNGTLLVSNKSTDNGVWYSYDWDETSDLYVTFKMSFNNGTKVYLRNSTSGAIYALHVNEFMNVDGILTNTNGVKSYVIRKDKLTALGFTKSKVSFLVVVNGEGWFNIQDISISSKEGFSKDKDTNNAILENTYLRQEIEFGQNPELISNSTTISNKVYDGLDLGTPLNAPSFTTPSYVKEVRVLAPADCTVNFIVASIDQNSLIVNTTYNIGGQNLKKGLNTIRFERSKVTILPGQRLFVTLPNVGIYDPVDDVPSFSKSLIRDNTHYINTNGYSGNQLYQTDSIVPFSYKVVEKDVLNKIADVATDVKTVSDSVQDLLPLKNNLFVKSPSGQKFILMVDDNGNLLTKSSIPTNVVVVGNSLTYNWGNFGLAASNPTLDWYAHVKDYVTSVNASATFNRFGLIDWENATTTSDRDTVFNSKMKPALSADTDLVIVQLGDNVNSDEKYATFANDVKRLIQNIKSVSPKATVVWVASWYQNYPNLLTDISNACSSTGATFVNIRKFATQGGNTSQVGAVQTDENGNQRTITDSGQASHPGDQGHKLIGDEVIRNFDF